MILVCGVVGEDAGVVIVMQCGWCGYWCVLWLVWFYWFECCCVVWLVRLCSAVGVVTGMYCG